MTGDDDDDDRPDQTRTNTKRMDHAIRDDLAAVVVPRESCRPPRVHCHSCDHEDRFPITRRALGAFLRASEGSIMSLKPLRRRRDSRAPEHSERPDGLPMADKSKM